MPNRVALVCRFVAATLAGASVLALAGALPAAEYKITVNRADGSSVTFTVYRVARQG